MLLKYAKKFRILLLTKFIYRKIKFGANFTCGRGTTFNCNHLINIGDNVYVGKYCSIGCNTNIGNNVLIADQVGIIGKYDHNFKEIGVPIRQASWIGDKNYNWKGKDLKVIIEDDNWIGFGSIILSGTKIGRGSIIAAGSVVTKDIEPYTIVAGNPAGIIGKRFNCNEIKIHEDAIKKKEI